MRVAYQKSGDKNHRSLGQNLDNSHSKLAPQVYMTMYSESLIKSHPTTVSILSSHFPNNLLDWNRGAY